MPDITDIIAQGPRPPQVETMTDASQKALSLQNAVQQRQLQQQEMQMNQIKLQQENYSLGQTRALNKAYQDALTVDPDGKPTIDRGKLTTALGQGGYGSAIPGIMKTLNDYDKSSTDLQKAKGEVAKAEAEHAGSIGAGVREAKYDPHLFMTLTADAARQGHVDPATVKPMMDQIGAALEADPTGAQAQALTKQYADQLIASSEKQRELDSAALTAQARKQTADTSAAKQDNEAAGQKADSDQKVRADTSAQLSKATNPAEYTRLYDAIKDPNLQKLFVPPEAFDPKTTPAAALRVGLTSEQTTKADQEAANATEQARHNKVDEGFRGATVRVEQGRLKVEQQRYGFESSGGVSDAARSIAAATIDPTTTRYLIRSNPGLVAQVKQIDPSFDMANLDNRYDTLKDFSSSTNGKAGGQLLALNTLIHHADLYMDVADSLKNGSFRPGNAIYNKVVTMVGGPAPTTADLLARFVAGEGSKLSTGGVPAEGEINGFLKTLGNDSSPEQFRAAANTIMGIAAGRMIPLRERRDKAGLQNVVDIVGPDARQILDRRGIDPETLQPKGQQGGGAGGQQGGGAGAPKVPTSVPAGARVAYNAKTKQFAYTTDGGKTWQIAK
jgi:hypothetical protein